MTTRPWLLRAAATLALNTGAGHLAGTLMPIPAEQTAMLAAVETMKATLVPFPVGVPRTYVQILDGNNFCTTVLLFLCAAQLFALAGTPRQPATTQALALIAAALAVVAVVSAFCFFPVPTVFTATAAVLTLLTSAHACVRVL